MDCVDAAGVRVTAGELKYPRSRWLSEFLLSEVNPHAKLVEVRVTPGGDEVIVFEVEVEVSQVRVFDIHPRERLAVLFRAQDDLTPEVLALRKDFPYVPHVNPRDVEIPRSLCLYEENFDELKVAWTPARFVERARWWLCETAKGTLHGEDQPLEPILLGNFPPLIMSVDLLSSLVSTDAPQPLVIEMRGDSGHELYVANPGHPATGLAAIAFIAPPHADGAIRVQPGNLKRLSEILKEVGLDIIEQLRQRLSEWELPGSLLNAPPILLIILRKQRRASEAVETIETWAFLLSKTIGDLGVALGILQRYGSSYGRVLNGQTDDGLIEATSLAILNPTFSLSRSLAARLNGTTAQTLKITAIGLGALGSQVVNHLVRAGFGIWTGVDDDILFPHNAAKHQLGQRDIGRLKVRAMQTHLNGIMDDCAMPTIVDTNVLHSGAKESELRDALSNAEAILDFSANLSVARKLAYYDATGKRRCSVFLNPSGSDLVLLCEDQDRKSRLDWLEFQYYRELVNNDSLKSHFHWEHGRIRYARSCRDLTSDIPQGLIAMHSGIASQALQRTLVRPEAVVRIWHSDSIMNVQCHDVDALPVMDLEIQEWRICTDRRFLSALRKYRRMKLPKETGGVVIGSFDEERRIAYLVDVLPSPPDSEEWPTLYIRGTHGLADAVKQAACRTDNQLQYMGEWHSHPDGYGTEPSGDDKKVFEWLAELAARDCNPPIMLIVGQKDVRIFLGSIETWVSLKK